MNEGRSLPELASELCRQADAKRDFLAKASDLHISSNGHSRLYCGEVIGSVSRVNEVAHGQFAEYLGIPRTYYDRLRGASEDLRVKVRDERYDPFHEDYPLFDVTVNTLLAGRDQDTRLIRTLDGTCRAFLSDSFSIDLDNYDVFRVAARVIEELELGAENVISAEVTERKLYLKVVSPKLEAEIKPENLERPHGGHHYLKEPQVVQAGVMISNSEVGLGSLSVQQVIYKLMCTNLWIMETPYRQRHVGKVLESGEDSSVYRSDTRLAEAKARLLKLRDHIAEALDEHRFLATTQKMQEATGVRLEGSIEKVVEGTARKFGLLQSEKEDVLKSLIEGADLSYWGLSNALTDAAHRAGGYDRSVELEAIGGRMLALPATEVKDLVRAT